MIESDYPPSHLFTLRVWREKDESGEQRWRGRLCHVPSQEFRFFRGWPALIPILLDMLRRHDDPNPVEQPLTDR